MAFRRFCRRRVYLPALVYVAMPIGRLRRLRDCGAGTSTKTWACWRMASAACWWPFFIGVSDHAPRRGFQLLR